MKLQCFVLLIVVSMGLFSMSQSGCSRHSTSGTASSPPMNENKQKEIGFLHGKVTIGPIYPHERPGFQNEASSEVYLAHRVAVFAQDGTTKIREVNLDGEGYYKVDLPAGDYVVDVIPHDLGIKGFGSTPQKVVVETGKTTTQDLEVDTGIR